MVPNRSFPVFPFTPSQPRNPIDAQGRTAPHCHCTALPVRAGASLPAPACAGRNQPACSCVCGQGPSYLFLPAPACAGSRVQAGTILPYL